jgi:CHAT domain-containing protein
MSTNQAAVRTTLSLFILAFVSLTHIGGPGVSYASLDHAQDAQALLDLSRVQNFENHALALETAQKALAIFQSVNDNVGVAKAYSIIGDCHLAQSNFIDSKQNYDLALQMWRTLGNSEEEARTLISLGYIEDRKSDFPAAMSLFTQAQTLITEHSEAKLKGQLATGLAAIFNDSGLPESGLIKYKQALDYYSKTESQRDDIRATLGIGYSNFLLGDNEAALSYLQDALTRFESQPPELAMLDRAECREYLARVHFSLGDYDAALQDLQPTIAIYESAGNILEAAQVRAMQAQIYEKQSLVGKARSLYLESLKTFRRLTDQVSEATVSFALGRLELEQKNYDLAEQYLRQSVVSTENIRQVSPGRDLTAAFSANVHARYEAYIECLMRQHLRKATERLDIQAFEASELSRARSLALLLRDTQTKLIANVDPELAKKEKTLRQAIRSNEDHKVFLLGTAYDREQLEAVQKAIERDMREYQRVVEQIRKVNPSFEQIIQPVSYTLQQIQENVIKDDETALLEYSLGSVVSYAWVVTRNNIRAYELPNETAVSDAARQVYELLSTKPVGSSDAELNRAATELSQLVLAPVKDQLNARKLIIVTDGALSYVPFQFLTSPADGQQLIANHEIVNAPSATVLGQLQSERASRRRPEKVLAAFGDAKFANTSRKIQLTASTNNDAEPGSSAWRDSQVNGEPPDLSQIQPLFYAKIELANLARIAGPESLLATGFDASLEGVEKTDLTKYAILHFATHGFFDSKRPESSGLLLSTIDHDGKSQNGFMTIQDIYSLQAPVDLVVLSACRTGLGKVVRGEGLIGLTRGFMYAGASSVVASLWRVDDEATAELMKYFYENMLQRQMTPATALREAQNSIRKQPRWEAPYYWAGFTIQGDSRQPIKAPPLQSSLVTGRTLVPVAVIGILSGVGWWYRRRRQYSTTRR